MSGRPGYDDLIAEYGVEVADKIISSAEHYSDAAHMDWDHALAWAKDRHDNPDPPELVAQQEINNALSNELKARRGGDTNPILYLEGELGMVMGGSAAFEYPERLALAERIFDERGSELGDEWKMGDAIRWAREEAARFAAAGEG